MSENTNNRFSQSIGIKLRVIMEIYINGEQADFLESSIQYVLNSPIFNEENGEAALDLNFPMTTRNKAIFGFAHRPERNAGRDKLDVVIKAGGLTKEGTGIVTEAGQSYKMNVGFDKSDFYHKIKNLTLRDLPFETVSVNGTASIQGSSTDSATINASHKGDGPREYTKEIPVSGLWFKTPSEDATGYIDIPKGYQVKLSGVIETDSDLHSGRTYLTLEYRNGDSFNVLGRGDLRSRTFDVTISRGNTGNEQYLSCRVVLHVTSKHKSGRKYSVKASLEPNSEGITLMAVLGQDISGGNMAMNNRPYPEGHYVLATVYNPGLIEENDENAEASAYATCPIVNHYQNGTFPEIYAMDGVNRTNMFCPFIYVAYIFDLIAAKTGYTIRRNLFLEDPEIASLVLYNNFIENAERKQGGAVVGFKRTLDWRLENHVSDLNLSEFIKVLKLFGVALFVDTQKKQIDMIPITEILSAPVGFDISVQLSEPVTLSKGYDSYELSFNAGESFAQDKCIDLDKSEKYVSGSPRIPAPVYNDIYVHSGWGWGDQKYYMYASSENMDEESMDGFILYGIALSSFTDTRDDSENTFSVEVPLGPVFSGYASQCQNADKVVTASVPEYNSGRLNGLFQKLVAYAEDQGILAGSTSAAEDMPTMGLSFYRGMFDNLPTLSHDIYPERMQKASNARIALKWEGDNGLYNLFWKPFLDWITQRARKAKIRIPVLPLADFMKLKTSYRVRINQQNYLIDTIQADLGDKVTNIEIEAYTC